jgi:ABC-type nitrate/sulfonate/bicarbonate transport system permease component
MAPVLLEAVRIAMIFNLTGILLAEMYASRAGLGQLIASWGENYMLKELLAGILLIAAAAILFNEAVRWFEARCEHWRS